ncbi:MULTISPECIES: DNA gyrase/topoisomerase IV subunit B [unclassified Roseburia]|uniref:DNA gyrase/topoisomerase IV subunit B n=1 Tax=unclassified Roseburia TaxID=2637578 RepID=UPI000E4310BC|nr:MULTISPECIES: DNA topoisomerase subunit B [unclassified Roseburia]RGF44848.1 type IIA DNA topoisomerase subunit B [Roseburia sp. AF42-8]RHQ41887.1 type IIA DNA topoisomerase subunit B [Roseburia sp. AF25-18LB]RHQ42565.1 type IIA DNA topoisomerase subunit B [Roseburia sp. AF25-25LB]RHQ48350.1 type IIA DNA topoisomerase subunit B [Roseburia sp. AF25-15LB]RHQ48693.1 type IIA DNA topoisomerase subunit B [Roseburia sp. AF25-13LB]
MAKQETYDASSISVLEGLEAVRKRPGMYIGSVSRKGLNHLIYEIVDNSVDEHLAGVCDTIRVTLEADGSCTVEDNGRGIPVGMHKKGVSAARVVFSTLHAGGKFDNAAYKTSGGLHGVGSSVVNALSTYMDVEISRDGYVHHDRYERGVPTVELVNGLLPTIGKTKKTGTKINFLPDPEIFEKTRFKEDEVKSRLHETAYLNPALTIIYEDRRGEEVEHIEYHEPDGIIGFVKEMNQNNECLHDVIYYKGESEGISVEVAFQYTTEFHENVLGFCNNIYNAEGGTHLTGFKTTFTQVINSYARELGILKEKDANFTGTDVRNGMTAVISVKHPDPRFEGQTKTKLDNQDAARATGKVTNDEIQMYFDRNLDTLKAIISCAEKAAKIRKTEEKAKTNLLTKQKFSFDSNGKLANCESRDASKCEIFIVEGDSAGGSAKTARNRMFQAILPIRGKILNVEKASIDKVLANAEIKTMIYAFGCGFSEGYGNDFDISKLRYDKIIIMADADVDGAHISTLLLTLFYRFMPELIYEGHVYIAMPPLYKAMPSKGEEEYLYDDAALARYRKTHKGSFTLQRYKGLGEMDANQLWETTLNPETRMLKQVEIEDARMASDVTEMLMGTDVPPRRKFIYDNAKDAELDI